MRVALCQLNAGDEPDANRKAAGELLDEAAERGADLAGLPELFTYLGASSRHPDVTETIPGPTSEWLQDAARRHGMWILGGSFLEADCGSIYNTSLLLDRHGDVAARYRKIHRFDVDLPGQPAIRESATTSAGEDVVSADTEFGVAGMSICYDLRFPELYRALAARGAVLLFVPAAFTLETGRDHWEVLLRARAIENQAFVIAPAQWGAWGRPEDGRRCYGRSLVADPWGTVVATAPDGVGVTIADLDLAAVSRVRERLPALAHRRL
ncbi:MAG TPA: carbon-nitrogen hydrolase family protein [Actinomycetota bacterium]|nr:carbon-nitrogen hydrolase family protein [Actinomycetota bacterium]